MRALRRILVGTDFSDGAAPAVERALRLGSEHDAEVLAVSVVPTASARDAAPAHAQSPSEELVRRASAQAQRRLRDQLAAASGTARVTAEIVTAASSPFHELVRLSRGHDVDLIVVGAHGRHFVHDLVLGTTAERVVRHADRPVLVVKQRPREGYRRLLVPLDFSSASLAALSAASQLAKDADIDVLHAYVLWFAEWLSDGGTLDADTMAANAQAQARAREALGEAVADAGLDPKGVTQLVRNGHAAGVITRAAEQRRRDLIAMGTRGRTPLSEVMLGGVAGHVLREARCDVLMVPAKARANGD